MINKLTKKQERQLVEYRDKWLAIGLSTDRIDRKSAIENFMIFNKLVLGNKETPVVIFMDSPLTTWLATLFSYILFYNKSQVRSQVWSQVESFVWPYLDGQFLSSYYSFYDYCNKVLKIKFQNQEKWDCYLKLSDISLIYPFEKFVVISEKPTQIKMKNMILHNENGEAIKYKDGFSVYALNGVRVLKELVKTPARQLDVKKFVLKETNAEIRREAVRKIGILLLLDLQDGRKRPYLKMKNPSLPEIYHIEGVHPSCDTIIKSLAWRASVLEQEWQEPIFKS